MHPNLAKREKKLKKIFDRIDDFLEEKYSGRYPLHPARSERGATSSKSSDGLFSIGAAYSLGIGSPCGAGYVIEIKTATLSEVPQNIKLEIEEYVQEMVGEGLAAEFPEEKFEVVKDGNVYRIVGDMNLGDLY